MSTANPDPDAGPSAFIPLECNPDVMTNLLQSLAGSTPLQFYDVLSVHDARLVNLHVPHPALALVLVFPSRAPPEPPTYAGRGPAEPVVWWPQTIKNSCGTMALLHAVCNGPARALIDEQSPLKRFLEEAIPLAPGERARRLEANGALAAAHQAQAREGDTQAPAATDDSEQHYVCFVAGADGALYELDGRRAGPVRLGDLAGDADMLGEAALAMGARRYTDKDDRCSLVALAAAEGL